MRGFGGAGRAIAMGNSIGRAEAKRLLRKGLNPYADRQGPASHNPRTTQAMRTTPPSSHEPRSHRTTRLMSCHFDSRSESNTEGSRAGGVPVARFPARLGSLDPS